MSRKRVLFFVAGLFGAVLVLGAGAVVALATMDLRPLLEFAARRMLDRPVSIGTLRIGWGNSLSIELTDLHLANAPWGSEPDMLRIDSLAAEIDPRALLHGELRYDKLRLGPAKLLLERNAAGDANWRFPKGGSLAPGHLALVPKDRTQFPTLLDMALHDGSLIFRVPGRRDLRLEFHDLTIRSPGNDQLVALAVDGAYNGNAARLSGETASFSVLRDRATPFRTDWSLATPAGKIAFQGTMRAPLDFDGIDGKIEIDAAKLGALLAVVGADLGWDVPLHLAGAFAKQDAHWEIAHTAGTLAKNRFSGVLALDEGGRGEADAAALDLAFAAIDLKSLIPAGGKPQKPEPISLRLEAKPGTTIDARIAAKQLAYGTIEVGDVAVHASSAPGAVSLHALSFAIAGGRIDASGSARSVKAGTRIAATLRLSAAEAAQIAALAGLSAGEIAGKLDARATVDLTGAVLADLVRHGSGQAVLAMSNGQVARDIVEKASTDLRALFRTGEGRVPVSCLLGVVDLRDGIATATELRLQTPDTILVGSGRVDVPAGRLDMTIKADSAGSRIFALDVPLEISGEFASLHVRPAFGARPGAAGEASAAPPLPPELQALVDGNPCRRQ